ncbi:MAG: hypothetical protein QGG36_10340 [Pirellulaceae bacterium]|jgi:hypothetical protein|nr:hypothetical protein [Pirellulaceae bacterium]MDP7016189.1 hypothetical protein [Pirellulaceae bacterium]
MASFAAIKGEKGTIYVNLEAVRVLRDNPSEDGVIVEFDDDHKIYLGRDQAAPLIKIAQG